MQCLASGVQRLGNGPSAFDALCARFRGLRDGEGVRVQSNTPRTLFYIELPATATVAHCALRGLASGVQHFHKGRTAFVCQVLWGGEGASNTPRTLL